MFSLKEFFLTNFAFPKIKKKINQRINNKVTMSSWINSICMYIFFYQYTPWPFIINAITMHKYKTVKYNKNTYSYSTCASHINRIQQFICCVWFWIRADFFGSKWSVCVRKLTISSWASAMHKFSRQHLHVHIFRLAWKKIFSKKCNNKCMHNKMKGISNNVNLTFL